MITDIDIKITCDETGKITLLCEQEATIPEFLGVPETVKTLLVNRLGNGATAVTNLVDAKT